MVFWLVVDQPLWKMMELKSAGIMKFPKYGKIKNVPNHQPAFLLRPPWPQKRYLSSPTDTALQVWCSKTKNTRTYTSCSIILGNLEYSNSEGTLQANNRDSYLVAHPTNRKWLLSLVLLVGVGAISTYRLITWYNSLGWTTKYLWKNIPWHWKNTPARCPSSDSQSWSSQNSNFTWVDGRYTELLGVIN